MTMQPFLVHQVPITSEWIERGIVEWEYSYLEQEIALKGID